MALYSCLALIEDETDQLYEMLVKKAGDRSIELLLNVILQETKGHEEIFKHLALLFDETYPPAIPDCATAMGELFTDSIEFTRNLKDRVQKGIPLLEAMQRLVGYEENVGEEFVTLMHSRLSALDEDDATIKKILEYIAKDEERHVEILKRAIQVASTMKRPD